MGKTPEEIHNGRPDNPRLNPDNPGLNPDNPGLIADNPGLSNL